MILHISRRNVCASDSLFIRHSANTLSEWNMLRASSRYTRCALDTATGIFCNGCKLEIPIRIRPVSHSSVAVLAYAFSFWRSSAYLQRGIGDIAALKIEERNSAPSTKSLTLLSQPYGDILYSSDSSVPLVT